MARKGLSTHCAGWDAAYPPCHPFLRGPGVRKRMNPAVLLGAMVCCGAAAAQAPAPEWRLEQQQRQQEREKALRERLVPEAGVLAPGARDAVALWRWRGTSLHFRWCVTDLSFFPEWACRPGPPMAACRSAAARFFWRVEEGREPRAGGPRSCPEPGSGPGRQSCGRAGAEVAARGRRIPGMMRNVCLHRTDARRWRRSAPTLRH